jgi:nucleolar protein 56
MTLYLYTNILGSYIFNENAAIIDEVRFGKEFIEKYRTISLGDWITEERTLTDKNRVQPIKVVNKKNEYFYDTSGIDLYSEDYDIVQKILAIFSAGENYAEIRKRNILITRQDMSTIPVDDVIIIQTVDNIEELEHSINTQSKRLREWYELYFPEASRALPDHKKFAEMIIAHPKKELMKELGIRDSMGVELTEEDIKPILNLAEKILALFSLKESHQKYLETQLNQLCPNVKEIVGVNIAGKLIAIAGSLERLSTFPASTVQTLGAEKAMFRHLKSGSRPPKYGVVLMHPMIAGAGNNKGKAARMLANKVSLAAKVDYFKGEKGQGTKFKKGLEEDIKKLKDKP